MSEQTCNCADDVDDKLAEHNTKLKRVMTFGQDPRPGIIIETEKVKPRAKGRAAIMLPAYCPFCGVKYPEA